MYVAGVERDYDDGVTRGGVTRWQTVSLGAMALLAAAVLIALVVTLQGADRERDRALQLQTHSYDVMILARTLSGTIARAEASLGRYVISGDKSQGQIYWDEWTLAGSQIDRLDRLTNDNPEQDPAIEKLREAYEARGKELSVTALSTSYGRNSQAYARYYQARKAPALNEINRDLNAIIGRERALLQQRVATATDTVERSSRIAGVLAIFGLLIVLGAILLGWLSLRAVGERALARADADAAREHAEALAEAVARTSAELREQEAKLRQVQKMDAVGQLTGGIAHDFNNMLAVVIGGIELAQRSVRTDPAAAERHLDSAAEGADRAAALTRRLLAFSREDALKPEPIAAAALVAELTDMLDRTLGDGVTLVTRNEAGDWRVRADRVQLENVIVNLAVNARDAVDGRGTIAIVTGAATLDAEQIGACAAGDYVTIAVRDDGCGMTGEIVDRVFEPFFTTKEAGKGTGLGLSQIFAFVRSQSGEITIDTAPGEGTAVTLYLPRDTMAVAKEPRRTVIAPAQVDRDGYDILVVEDDPRVLAATTGALAELGHRTISCSDPLAAPDLLGRHPHIDLVISDVLMPRQSGPEMVAGLATTFPQVAILFVTGFAGDANAAEFGDHHVLRKPFTLAGLERAIATSMREGRPSPEQIAAE
ncbi:ATP-binding protein [Sphingomonas sp. Leaf343]|uniref:ATP-binding protein n=1 Tax=Sphingomonas sp. Leaf343 TaxID=1736345 RepID=UPI0006F9AD19|nr:ATP-binding protein [Sphingomonas sp. Leaf343]KQR87892.1 kinase [Sphingomonas sp. Leaf343]